MTKKTAKRAEKNEVKFAYIRDERDTRRVMTIARKWGKKFKSIKYAYTICNPDEDQFQKAEGRRIATERLEDGIDVWTGAKCSWKVRPEPGEHTLPIVVQSIADNVETSSNTWHMAEEWLKDDFLRRSEDIKWEARVEELFDVATNDLLKDFETVEELVDEVELRLVERAEFRAESEKLCTDTPEQDPVIPSFEHEGNSACTGGCALSSAERSDEEEEKVAELAV